MSNQHKRGEKGEPEQKRAKGAFEVFFHGVCELSGFINRGARGNEGIIDRRERIV